MPCPYKIIFGRETALPSPHDVIEDGITDELLEGGVPENCIVLAFHSPEVCKHTGFAIA